MNIPKPLLRGGAVFILLGSVAAVLPGQFGQASADSVAFSCSGSTYVLRAANDTVSPPASDPGAVTLSTTTTVPFHAYVSVNSGAFQKASAAVFANRTLTFAMTNNANSAGTIALGGITANPGTTATYTSPTSPNTGFGGNLAKTTSTTTGSVTTSFTYNPGAGQFTLIDVDTLST